MSLWKVPDEQTKELMVDFYKQLIAGIPRAEALREAQLAMKEKYLDPYYWRAFIRWHEHVTNGNFVLGVAWWYEEILSALVFVHTSRSHIFDGGLLVIHLFV